MKRFLITLLVFIIPLTFFAQEKKEKGSPIKSYELRKDKKITVSKRNPFLKKEEIIIPNFKKEEKQKEEENLQSIPRLEFKGFLESSKKKLALIYIDGIEAIVEEGEEIMNFKILSIKGKEIEVLYILTGENLKISLTGGE